MKLKIHHVKAAAAMIALTAMMTACTDDNLGNLADDNMGGDHPGVILQLAPPTITLQGITIDAATRAVTDVDGNSYNSQISVQLIDTNGNPLTTAAAPGSTGKEIRSYYEYSYGEWIDKSADYDYQSLYVTGGSGNYRMRVYGFINTDDKGPVSVAYAGTVQVTDNGNGTGSFSLTPVITSAAVQVKLKNADGVDITSLYTHAVVPTGMATIEYSDSFYNPTATATADMRPTRPKGSYTEMRQNATTNSFLLGNILPGIDKAGNAVGYPAAWQSDVAGSLTTDDKRATDYGDQKMGSLTTLMTVYAANDASITQLKLNQGKLQYTTNNGGTWADAVEGTHYIAFPVKTATPGEYTMEAGKLYTFTLVLNGSDIYISDMTVAGFDEGEDIWVNGSNLDLTGVTWFGTMQQFVNQYNSKVMVSGSNKDYTAANAWLQSLCDPKDNVTGRKILFTDTEIPADRLWSNYDYNATTSLKVILNKLINNSIEGGDTQSDYRIGIEMPLMAGTGDIPAKALRLCHVLSSFSAPKLTGGIGNGAFDGCVNLTSFSAPKMKGSIGDRAFKSCEELTSFSAPKMEGSIGEQAFENCVKLKNVSLPSMKGDIDMSAFSGCSILANIDLSSIEGSLKGNAFSNCGSDESVSEVTIKLGPVGTTKGSTATNGAFLYFEARTKCILIFTSTPKIGTVTQGNEGRWLFEIFKNITIEQE